jgi:hypothetical protein
MGLFVFAIIIAVIGVILIAAGNAIVQDSKDAWIPRSAGAAVIVLGFLLFAISGLKSVPVKNIGVAQAFGAVSGGFYSPGIHETWQPWIHLTDIDETVQTDTFEQGSPIGDPSCHGYLAVRIGGQQTACADITIQWKVLPSAAGSLFSDYANQGDLMTTVTDAVVIRELRQTVNNVLGDYNPIQDQENAAANGTSQFSTFGPIILADMQRDIGSRIQVQTVLMPLLTYDTTTQNRLNTIQQAYANDAIAKEDIVVNTDQAKAYAALGSPSVNALVSQCLGDLKDDAAQLPVGFQCFPGNGSGLALSGK